MHPTLNPQPAVWSADHQPELSLDLAAEPLVWVIAERLAIGQTSPLAVPQLLEAGISVILSMWADTRLPTKLQTQFECIRVRLDNYPPDLLTVEQLATLVGIVHHNLDHQRPLYIHCQAGIEPSLLVCLAYLCRYRDLTVEQAMTWLQPMAPGWTPTASQWQVLQDWFATVD